LNETTQAHLEQLVAERTLEGPHIDFKRELPAAWNDGVKHDLYADASAFANAGGGDLIFGLDEDDEGQAAVLMPQAVNSDETARRLADFLSNGIEPRIPGAQVHAVPVATNGAAGSVFIIRVPQSWAGPNRVRSNFKFYIREGNRKRELNTPEIRGLFVKSDNQAQRVQNFRTERLGKILAGEAPCRLAEGSMLVLHLIPTQAALGIENVDPLRYLGFERQLPCIGGATMQSRINIDGALGLRNARADGATHGYTQLFRNGFVEALFVVTDGHLGGVGIRRLPSRSYEEYVSNFFTRAREEIASAGLHPEIAAMMSLLDADQIELGFDRINFNLDANQGRFDRKTVVLPDVLVAVDAPLPAGLKPMFDLVWQAAGMPGSVNFNDAGDWAPRR
jgi:hypothetical protein